MFCLIQSVLTDACNFPVKTTLQNIGDVEACLKQLPLTQEFFEQEQRTMEFFAKAYVHAPLRTWDSIPSEEPIDLDAEMKKLRNDFKDCSKSAYEYLRAMQALVARFKDLHYAMSLPSMFSNMNQVSPISLVAHDNGTMTFVPLEYSQAVFQLYEAQILNLTGYINKPIKTINGKNPYDFVQAWADLNVQGYRTQGSRFNKAMLSTFSMTQFVTAPPVDETFDVVLEDGQAFQFRRVIALNTEIPDFATLQKLWNASMKKNPYDGITPQSVIPPVSQDVPEPVVIDKVVKALQASPDTAITDFQALNYSNGFFAGFKYIPTGDFVLQVAGFGPSNYTDGMYKLLDCLEKIKQQATEGSKLFISVVGNGGGDPTISALLNYAIFPDIYPIFARTQMRRARFWDLTSRGFTLLWQSDLFEPALGGVIYDAKFNVTAPPQDWVEQSNAMFGGNYSDQFSFSNDRDPAVVSAFLKFKGLKFNPNRVIVIADGTCASAAGYLTESLRSRRIGVFVRIGGGEIAGSERFDQICAVPGGAMHGSVLYEASVQYNLAYYSAKFTQEELAEMKQYYLPHDGMLYITTFQTFGFDTENPMTFPLDFTAQKFDLALPYVQPRITNWGTTSGLDTYIPKLVELLKDYNRGLGDVCIMTGGVENAVYRIDVAAENCVFFSCKYGYYPVMNGQTKLCEKRIDPWFTSEEPVDPTPDNKDSSTTAIIVLSVLLGLFCIATIVLTILMLKHKRPQASNTPLIAV